MKKLSLMLAALCLVALSVGAGEWKPNKMINLIVPWGAGGSSDLTARILASEMEGPLGVQIAVVNQPGASGATGSISAYNAPHDGYTWVGSADANQALYQLQELTPKISHKDWQGLFAVSTVSVICVNPKSNITDWASLINAFKTREVPVASAGVGAGGHIAAEVFAKQAGVKYKHIPYNGGNPAVVATVAGESEVIMQLSNEVADMLRAKRLRAIACMSDKPLVIDGYGTIPPVTDYIKGYPPVAFYFGLFLPKDTPADVTATISKAFDKAAASKALKDMAAQKACVAVNFQGADADKIIADKTSLYGWLLYESGQIKVNPETLGIPKP